jgi:hypothetical protein
MKKMLLRGIVFLAVFVAATIPSMRLVETLLTWNISSDPPSDFPVLARSSKGNFVIVQLRNLPGSNPVLEIADRDLEQINKDLRAKVSSDQSPYAYFKVLGRGAGYTDVSLEVPTKGDFWSKGWYRIQDKSIHPQRIINYGPTMAIFIIPLSLLAGAIGVLCFNRMTRRNGAKPQTLPH